MLKMCADYSMLSKTNVHHFAGNNVSPPFPHPEPNPQTCTRRYHKSRHGLSRYEFTYIKGNEKWTVIADKSVQIELGTACGKLYRCSTMAVLDAGDSDILASSGQS